MNNVKFEGNVPKTLRAFAMHHAEKIAEVTGKGVWGDDAYDVAYRYGWKSGSDPLGAVHSDIGHTVAELMSMIRGAIRCDCCDCV